MILRQTTAITTSGLPRPEASKKRSLPSPDEPSAPPQTALAISRCGLRWGSNTPARYAPVKICRGVSTARMSGSAKSSSPSLGIEAKITGRAASGGRPNSPIRGLIYPARAMMRPNQSHTEAMAVIAKKMGIALVKNWLRVPWVSRQMADQRGISKNVRR